jgi:hypothetical protein
MRYERVHIDTKKLEAIIESRGMRTRDFCTIMWGDDTHRSLADIKRRPNFTIETAMKICNILDISLDELFSGSDKIGDSPYIVGNQNIVNSAVYTTDVKALQAENRALRLLVREKEERIKDLKKVKEELGRRLDYVLKLGQNSDTK